MEIISTRSAISRRVVDAERVAPHLHTAEDDGQTQNSTRLDNGRTKVHIIGNLTCSVFYSVRMYTINWFYNMT